MAYRDESATRRVLATDGIYNGNEAPREHREIERLLLTVHSLVDNAGSALNTLDDLRARLLGLSEPQPPTNAKEPAQLVRAELPELGMQLERLTAIVATIHQKLADLQRI